MARIDKIQEVEVSALKPYERNAKIHSANQVEQIANSIKEFGFISPILIDKDLNVIAGHGRIEACKKLDIKQVPCVFIEGLTEEQRRAYILADNKLTELGDWNMDLVSSELEELKNLDFDINITGFSIDDIQIEDIDSEEEFIGEPEDNRQPPRCKKGEVYQLGKHRLMIGDSTNMDDVKKLTGGCKADLLLTDPPYNVSYVGKTEDALTIENDTMDDLEFIEFLKTAFSAANDSMKEGAAFYIWHADSKGYEFRTACKEVGWTIRECLVWNKNTMVLGRQDYQWKHEPCLYGWKDGAPHIWNSDRSQTTVLEYDKPSRNGIHQTMKPVALFKYLIHNSSKEGDIVLDLFGGSGTSIIASEELNRICYSMELDPMYAEAIMERWESMTGKEAVKI